MTNYDKCIHVKLFLGFKAKQVNDHVAINFTHSLQIKYAQNLWPLYLNGWFQFMY